METKLKASNIKCAGCVDSITKNLLTIDGIKGVNVMISTGEVTIESDVLPDMEAIRSKLKAIGYPEKEELLG